MPENVGEFEVVVKGRVDSKLGEELEQNIKKHSKRASEQTEKNFIEKFINIGKKFNKIFKSPSLGKFLRDIEKLSTGIEKAFGGIAAKVSTKKGGPEMPVSRYAMSEEQAGGVATVGGKGGGGLLKMGGKLGILAGAVMLIAGVLKTLAPIQAILKMIFTVLQITLYPIAQLLLMIFKPILGLLLKYLIIPFYSFMQEKLPILMKIFDDIAGFIGGLVGGAVGAVVGGLSWLYDNLIKPAVEALTAFAKFVWSIFEGIVAIASANFKTIFDLFMDVGSFLITFWSGIASTIVNIFMFFGKTIIGVLNLLLGPIITFVSRVIKNPADILGAIAGLGDDLLHTGDRFSDFAKDVSKNWETLQTDTTKIMENILQSGSKIFTDLQVNIQNSMDITKNVVSDIFTNISSIATSGFGTISTSFQNMVDAMKDAIPQWSADSWSNSGWSGNYGDGGWPNTPWSSDANPHEVYYDSVPYATGGIVTKPTKALIGEAGPEAIIPLTNLVNSRNINTKLNLGGMSSPTININNPTVRNDFDIDEIVRQVERALYINTKRAGIR